MQKKRDIILVLGRTGQGKSVWTRTFLKPQRRLFAYDPLMETNVSYYDTQKLLSYYDKIEKRRELNGRLRIGARHFDDVPLLNSSAYLSQNCWLSLEEASVVFEGNHRCPDWIRDSIFIGRHVNLSILVTAQRPTSIPVDLRSQASRVVCFNQHEKKDVSWLENFFGERIDEIPTLKPLECLDGTNCEDVKKYFIDVKNDDKYVEKKEDFY